MKACYLLLLLWPIASIIHAQDSFEQKHIPIAIQHTHTNQSASRMDCNPPTDFEAHVYTTGYDQYMLYLTWDMNVPDDEWIHWDDGVYFSGIGCCYVISAAARWDSGYLAGYHNFRITKMRVILNDTHLDSLVFKIWNGGYESDLIYLDTIHEFYAGTWIEHELESDIYINSAEELLVGYTAIGMPAGTFTLGTDDGPAISGYGDLIRPDNDVTWDALSDYGLEYNWNIQFYAEDTSGNSKQVTRAKGERNINFIGYNLYQSIDGGDYELLEFIPYESDSNYYALPLDASPELYCYQLTALWTSPIDSCESEPAKAIGDSNADSVCVLLVGAGEEMHRIQNGFRCYPNPFSTSATIEYWIESPQTVTITFYNRLGKQVDLIKESQQEGLNQIVWSPENLPDGIYHFRLGAEKQTTSGKLILLKNR